MAETPSAAEGLAELIEARSRAQARVDQLEAEQRGASETRETARMALIEAERKGIAVPQRAKLEKALSEAEARTAERWPERVEGARAAVRDADGEVRLFATEHITELVEGLERDGQIAADRVNEVAHEFLNATQRRAQAEQNLLATVGLVRQIDWRDYNRSQADEAVAAVSALLQQGGEVGPALSIELSAEAVA